VVALPFFPSSPPSHESGVLSHYKARIIVSFLSLFSLTSMWKPSKFSFLPSLTPFSPLSVDIPFCPFWQSNIFNFPSQAPSFFFYTRSQTSAFSLTPQLSFSPVRNANPQEKPTPPSFSYGYSFPPPRFSSFSIPLGCSEVEKYRRPKTLQEYPPLLSLRTWPLDSFPLSGLLCIPFSFFSWYMLRNRSPFSPR